jgi:ABC-2 type transport system ATP-binding protein
MEHAEQLCDFILLINQGKKVIDGRIDEIKSRYSTNTVIAKIEGNADFLNDLPMVESIRKNGEATEINLRQNDQDQLLLNAMVGRVKIRAFEVKRPSLHEIFVNLVGNHHDYTVRT